MPSQEDYLDNLLKDMTENKDEQWLEDFEDAAMDFDAMLDSVSELSEEEIEKLLSAGEELEEDFLSGASDLNLSDEDVLKMLEETDDGDLQEIQELLEKSDRNEAVDDSIEDLLLDMPEDEDLEARILGESQQEELLFHPEKKADKKKEAQEKKELARIKREQKKQQTADRKAAKKAAREAAKEAKTAAKEAKIAAKETKTAERERRAAEKAEAKAQRQKKEKKDVKEQPVEVYEDISGDDESLFDMSILDSIVSEADSATLDVDDSESEALGSDLFAESELFAEAFEEVTENTGADTEVESAISGDEGFGLDIGELFGTGDADASILEGDDNSDFPDFISLGDDTADSIAADFADEAIREETKKEKKGLFSKIVNLLTEEEEENQNENIKLSRENRDILNALDSETDNRKGKKGKKGKKEKPVKDKKEKAKKESKTPQKPKKVKPQKLKPVREKPIVHEKKLSFKKILPVVLIGVSVGVLLFVFINSASEYSDKKAARDAFYEGDYQTCYQNLHGKDLDETESIMYGKSESVLYIRLWIREYEMFVEEGLEVEALDSLIQTVTDYPDLYEYANRWNAGNEVTEGYATVLNILADKYGLSETQALEISAEPDDVEYTRRVTAIATGNSSETMEKPESEVVPEQPKSEEKQDVLPEEEGLGQDSFIDNQ